MSTISNKFFVSLIEDGTTLHGELRATKSLTQAWTGSACVPDWSSSHVDNRPLIYISLMNGTDVVTVDSGSEKWYYNGTLITWSSSVTTQNIGGTSYQGYVSTNCGGVFFKTTYTLDGKAMPAMGIIGNLANMSDVVDIDVIRFEGQKTLSTNPVDFAASTNITISDWVNGGYLGVINFQNGRADITRDNNQVVCQGYLYDDGGNVISSATYKWYFEGDPAVKSTTQTLTVSEADVTDYVVVKCEFYMLVDGQNTLVYTAYAGIDDTQDPEYMWIQYNGANGNSASLRKNESVAFRIWVGKEDDPTVNTSWISFKLKTLDSEGNVVTAAFDNIPAAGSDGYRTLSVSGGVAQAEVTYDDVETYCKKGLTGIIIASTSNA